MKKRSFTIIIISAVFIIVGFAMTSYSIVANNGIRAFWNKITHFNKTETTENRKIIINDNINSISLEFINSNIDVQTSDDDNIRIEYVKNPHFYYNETLAGPDISVSVSAKFKMWNFGIRNFRNTAVNVYIPNDIILQKLKLKTVNGIISMKDICVDSVSADTVNGKIDINTIIKSDIDLKTVNGDIYLNTFDYCNADINTVNGSSELQLFGSRNDYDINMVSLNGKLYINNDSYSKKLRIDKSNEKAVINHHSVNGKCRITVNE